MADAVVIAASDFRDVSAHPGCFVTGLITEEVVLPIWSVDARRAGFSRVERDGDVQVLQARVAVVSDREVVNGDATVLEGNLDGLLRRDRGRVRVEIDVKHPDPNTRISSRGRRAADCGRGSCCWRLGLRMSNQRAADQACASQRYGGHPERPAQVVPAAESVRSDLFCHVTSPCPCWR